MLNALMLQRAVRSLSALILICAVSVTSACGEEGVEPEVQALLDAREKRLKNKKKKKKKTDANKKAVRPITEEDLAFTYSVIDRRDPFKTYFDEGPVDNPSRADTELQRFELEKLRLVAVVVGTSTPMAMVEDPSGLGHTVRIGTLIGKRLGQVKAIRRGEIVVQEELRDFTGKIIPVKKKLQLETPDEN